MFKVFSITSVEEVLKWYFLRTTKKSFCIHPGFWCRGGSSNNGV